MKWLVCVLIVFLSACAPAAQRPVKQANAEMRVVVNVDRSLSYRDALQNASEGFKALGYTVVSSEDSFRDYGLVYNDTLKADVENAVRLASAATAQHVVFIYSQPTSKDPPFLSGFTRYVEVKATASIVMADGKLLRRVEAMGAAGSNNRNDSVTEVAIAALPATMKAVALKVNEVINP